MHIARQMPERIVILLTGRGVGLLEHSCKMARLLQPATVILEDVDSSPKSAPTRIVVAVFCFSNS